MTDKDEKWALFWCSLLRPVLFGEIEAKEANRYLKGLAQQEYVFPDGRRKKASHSTLKRKLKLYREALNMARGTLGVAHPQTARVLVNMGVMYASQGRYGIAVPLLEEALLIREEHLPSDHILMAETLEHTATALRGVGQVAKAESFDRRAREIRGEPLENDT